MIFLLEPVIDPEVVATAGKLGIGKLNQIQMKAMPAILAGKDVLVIAPTGFGKTEAAILPVLSAIKKNEKQGIRDGIQAVYVTPLRALNRDILLRLEKWCAGLGITLQVRHGDTPQSARAKQRDNPPQFLITTPETLSAVLIAPKLSDFLSNTRFVIVDEWHELAESKRGLSLGLAIARLRRKSAFPLQVIGLSATVGDPNAAAKSLSKKAVPIVLEEKRGIALSIDYCDEKKQQWDASAGEKTGPLIQKIGELVLSHKKTLIFSNTRSMAEWLGSKLHQLPQLKDRVAVHHSSLSSAARTEAENGFKNPAGLRAIVCTSSLELGIDIGEADLVIQVSSPRQAVRLLQRVGRSGHREHLVPKGEILCTDALDCAQAAAIGVLARCGELEKTRTQRPALDVLAHHIVGALLDNSPETTLGKILETLVACPAYEKIKLKDCYRVCIELARKRTANLGPGQDLPGLDDFEEETQKSIKLRIMPRTKLYYYENLSTIADRKNFFIKNATTNRNLGVLDEDFAAEFLDVGAAFISRGKPWKVLSISEDEIVVEEAADYSAAIPEWRGEEIPVSFEAAARTAAVLSDANSPSLPAGFCAKYDCTENAALKIRDFTVEQNQAFCPDAKKIFVEELSDQSISVHAFLGSRFNEALAMAVQELSGSNQKNPVMVRSTAYGVTFFFPKKIKAEKLAAVISQLTPERLEYVVKKRLPNTPLFRARFAQVAKRFGIISRRAANPKWSFALRGMIERMRSSPVFEETLDEIAIDKLELDAVKINLENLFHNGKIQVEIVAPKTPSPLARARSGLGAHKGALAEAEPNSAALEEFVNGIKTKTAGLVCTFCGNTFSKQLGTDLNESVVCLRCGSTQISTWEYLEVLKERGKNAEPARKKKGKIHPSPYKAQQLQTKGKEKEMLLVSNLVSSFGMRAVIALSVFGIGPETAARILGRMHKSEEEFYHDLLAAQKTFIRTKQFWKR